MVNSPEHDEIDPFDQARAHIEAAKEARSDLAQSWNDLRAARPFSHQLVSSGPTSGRLEVRVIWPDGVREAAERAAAKFVESIVGAFDAAVRAAVSIATGEPVVKFPDARMPMCLVESSFIEASTQPALRHLRPDQLDLLFLFQPMGDAPLGHGVPREVRRAMDHLRWVLTTSAQNLVAVWVHTASPQFRTIEGDEVIMRCKITPPGVLLDSHTIAEIDGLETALSSISSNPGTEFSLVLDARPYPDEPADAMGERTAGLIVTATAFIDAIERSCEPTALLPGFEWIAQQIARRDRSPWGRVDLKRGPFRRQLRRALRRSGLGLATLVSPDGDATMFIRSKKDIYARPIPHAKTLPEDMVAGPGAEHASLLAAGEWGLRDFVLRPHLVRKGEGSREVGDGTVVVGDCALAIQVKARELVSDSAERELRWLSKQIGAGGRQASGTIRTLRMHPTTLRNLRDREIEVDGSKLRWVRVVIIEHPQAPRLQLGVDSKAADPVVVLYRRDWEFLLDQLRSLTGVVDYLFRICSDSTYTLGDEATRYFELAQLDAKATNGKPASWTRRFGSIKALSSPRLPLTPASRLDTTGHVVFSIILDDIAEAPWDRDENDRLHLLSLLDRFPVADRSALGQLLLDHLQDVMSVTDGVKWRFRRVLLDGGRLQLAFGAASRRDEQIEEAFRQWGMLRHHEFTQHEPEPSRSELRTVAVLLTPCHTGLRYWDTTMLAVIGDLQLEPDEVTNLRRLWSGEPAT
ncbi:hypothetical protein [Ilumatobacter sp.]|uniref:hypothetical protein n=2 Tax=Ilumatobacter sp. TaxID=1967498 RepID=UPI003752D63F